jgi:hypothetical protein
MKFIIPRDHPDEMVLYVWKIVDLPHIFKDKLLYNLIFKYFIFTPDKALAFIDDALKQGYLVQDKNIIKLSDELNQQFIEWQKKRNQEIKNNLISRKKRIKTMKGIQINSGDKFNHLLKKIIDSAALNRAVAISDDAIDIIKIDKAKGILEARIKGTKEESYIANINLKKRILLHNCHDFETRRAKAKHFCKHLIKLFLTLRKENPELAIYFLENIIKQINNWEFSS